MLLFSQEWVDTYAGLLNESAAYEEAAKTWEGDFIFIALDDKTKEVVKAAYFDLWHGKSRQQWEVTDVENPGVTPEFVIQAPMATWKLVLAKKLDPIQGLMAGKLRLTGTMTKIMRAVKAAQELVNTTTKVETEFE
ncbi:MAG TPA: SCP2 sterol-binding domain-containing protein [Candidatus Lokiarchaeia archaeon]|nr:SCP2 sterol-binding domain-containing protein [Candidatus Lokiarchaeia archaeon]